jgi:hypothetical protein
VRRAALIVLAAVCGGCGGQRDANPVAAKVAIANRTHEYPSPSPRPQTADGGAASAEAAIRAFAIAYINWSADTVAGDMRTLASQSIGQARSAVQLAAAQTAADYELQDGGISNSGVVEAVTPLAGVADRYIVVTREATSATNTTAYQGLRPAWHVTIATVSRLTSGAWVVSAWQPQV